MNKLAGVQFILQGVGVRLSRAVILLWLVVLSVSTPATADDQVIAAYLMASQTMAITPSLAYAVALAHSGVRLDDQCLQPWPWTLTLGTSKRFYRTQAEANAAWLDAIHRGIRPIKVGLLQVDGLNPTLSQADLLSPTYNLQVGLILLKQQVRHQGSWGAKASRLARQIQRTGLASLCRKQKHSRITTQSANNGQRGHIDQLVNQIASVYTIDPALVMAVIAQESGFNVSAQSNKQAQGLMQLIPETAQRFGVRNPFDPEQNIRGGIAYLHWLLRHFRGDVALTLAGYNAGENAVDKYQGIPPYRETQQYVSRIMAHYPRTLHPIPPVAPWRS
jgi:hypothetical protein